MNTPANLKYAKTHEYAQTLANGHIRVGITDFAQKELGDLVFVNLPNVGDSLTAGEALGDLESVKAVADVLSPVTGKVCAVNEELLEHPEKINEAPYESWLVEVEDGTPEDGLMDAAAYTAFCETEHE